MKQHKNRKAVDLFFDFTSIFDLLSRLRQKKAIRLREWLFSWHTITK